MILYSLISYPFRTCFNEYELIIFIFVDFLIDIIFAIEIYINFHLAYLDPHGNLIKNKQKIKEKYMKYYFKYDLISTIPIEIFFIKINYSVYLNQKFPFPTYYVPIAVRIFRMLKALRFLKISQNPNYNVIKRHLLDKINVSNGISQMIQFFLFFLLLCHLSACLFFYLGIIQDGNPDNWVFRYGLYDFTISEKYIFSFYWTLTTITTVGYGDIVVGTTIEKLFNCVIMVFGVIMYSFAIGSLSSLVSNYQSEANELKRKLQILEAIQNEYNIDNEVIEKARKVIKFEILQNHKDKNDLIEMLPNKLRIELSKAMYHKDILKLNFFRNKSADYIAYVSSFFKSVRFYQEHLLYKVGDIIEESKILK